MEGDEENGASLEMKWIKTDLYKSPAQFRPEGDLNSPRVYSRSLRFGNRGTASWPSTDTRRASANTPDTRRRDNVTPSLPLANKLCIL